MAQAVAEACLTNETFGKYLEDNRAKYLSFAIDALPNRAALKLEIWEQLLQSKRSRRQGQLLGIASIYARRREAEALRVLERICTRNLRAGHPESMEWLIETDPERGLRLLIDEWQLSPRADQQIAGKLLWRLEEALGKFETHRRIEAHNTPGAIALQAAMHPPQSDSECDSLSPLESVRQEIAKGRPPRKALINALSETEFAELAASQPVDGKALSAWLQVFSLRRYPADPVHLFRLARRGPISIRKDALCAIVTLKTPESRAFAKAYLDHPWLGAEAIRIFELSLGEGDEQTLSAWLQRPRNRQQLHLAVMALMSILNTWGVSNRAELLSWIYDHSPCSECRASAFADLDEMGCASESMRAEAIWDACSETRKLARKAVTTAVTSN